MSLGAGALLAVQDPLFFTHRARLADLEVKNRLPTMYGNLEHVEAGGFMAYTSNRVDLFGVPPATWTGYSKARARRTFRSNNRPSLSWPSISRARTPLVTIPFALLARADEVIE